MWEIELVAKLSVELRDDQETKKCTECQRVTATSAAVATGRSAAAKKFEYVLGTGILYSSYPTWGPVESQRFEITPCALVSNWLSSEFAGRVDS